MNDLEGGISNASDQQRGTKPRLSNPPPTSSPATDPIEWPSLGQFHFSCDDLAERRRAIGGSDANIILSGNAERILQLWRVKRGEAEPADLSTNLSVMLGCWTEVFNRQWYERLTGNRVTSVGRQFTCRRYNWRRCTVDGFVEEGGAVWEAKHTNAFAAPEEVLERYMPQLQHNMAVAGKERAVLSVIFGNHRFELFEVAADWLYQSELLEAEQGFWSAVLTGERPVAVDPPPAPRPVGTREVCLEGNNAWAAAACDWLEHRAAAKTHASACVTIKSLVETGVARAFGHGIAARRSKSGAITIQELA